MIAALLAVLGVVMAGMALAEPLGRSYSYWINSLFPNRLPTETELVEALFRGIIDEKKYKEAMKQLGFDEKTAMEMFEIRKALLTAEQATVAYWRGIIDEKEYKECMKKAGYSEELTAKYEKLHRFYPSATDFIRFAVRDVYNETIVKKYGYDEEFPESIIKDVAGAGMDEKWIRYYWRAHWELPSPTQGYVMLHRLHPDVLSKVGEKYREMGLEPEKLVTKIHAESPDDIALDELLKIADYPKPWRDRLIAISYSPLTRVDLRRIYELGLIDDEEMVARLMELGYTRKDAELLLNFFKIQKGQRELDKVRSKLDDLYKAGKISKEELVDYYKSMGYSETEIELLITWIEYEKKEQQRKAQLKLVERQFKKGFITEEEAKKKLNELGILTEHVDYYINLWKTHIKTAEKHITKADVEKMVKYGVINVDEAARLLKDLGYSDKAVRLLIDLYKKEFGIE